jgi:hypothetical protein
MVSPSKFTKRTGADKPVVTYYITLAANVHMRSQYQCIWRMVGPHLYLHGCRCTSPVHMNSAMFETIRFRATYIVYLSVC